MADPYRWLEPDEGAECEQWLTAQEEWLAEHAATWESRPVFRTLLDRYARHGAPVTPPLRRGDRWFSLSCPSAQDLPALMTTDAEGTEQVVFDPQQQDPSGKVTLKAWRPSRSGAYVICQTSAQGSESPALRVIETATGREADAPLHPGRFTPVAWLPDDSGFYYTTLPAEGERQVRLHLFGSPEDRDTEVFSTPWRQLSVSTAPDGDWLVVSCAPGAQSGNALFLATLTATSAASPDFVPVHDGSTSRELAQIRFGPHGLLYAITTTSASGGRVCALDPASPHAEQWTPLITPEPGTVLSACVALAEPGSRTLRYLVSSLRAGSAQLALHDEAGGKLADIATPGTGPGTITRVTVPPGDPTEAWFTYADFTTAPALHRFSLTDRRCHPAPTPAAARGQTAPRAHRHTTRHTRREVSVRQVAYRSEDGTPVPLLLITPPQSVGPTPTLLTAYGGFGAIAAPGYSPEILSWVAAGGAYAIAGVRGGGEQGAAWHAAGSGKNKPNAFADYAAAARWLITQGLTTPQQLAVKGGSHSGLMTAVAITRDPHLFAAAVCSGAVTDMIRYPRFGLGPWWTGEFGDPADPEAFTTLLSYSPYHHVQPQTAYPAVLVTTCRTDPRVGAAHSRKFVAALQHATNSKRPVLLRCENATGHAPPTDNLRQDTTADVLAFCATHTGLRPSPDLTHPGHR